MPETDWQSKSVIQEASHADVVGECALRNVLRASTMPYHQALENAPLMRAVSQANPSSDVYADYLSRQWLLHAPLERALGLYLDPATVSERLLKTAWLESDLRAMGQHLPTPRTIEVNLDGRDAAIGALYVLEGATLGLRSVVRRLPDTHPARQGAGRYMAAYGEQTGERWAMFLRQLEATAPSGWPSACQAAQATFACFVRVFEGGCACATAM